MEEFNWLGREEFILFSKFWEWNTKNLVLVAFDICEFDRESDRAFVIEQTTLLLSGNWKKYWKFFFFFFNFSIPKDDGNRYLQLFCGNVVDRIVFLVLFWCK